MGYPEQARQRLHEGLTLAQELAHPLSLSVTFIIAARFHALRGEQHAVRELAARLTSLATAHGFAQFVAAGTIMQSWSVAMQGQAVPGILRMRQALEAYRLTGAQAGLPHYLTLLAEAHGLAGQPEEGLRVIAEALALARQHEDHVYDAVLYRLQGELLLACPHEPHPAAEACFQQALAIARRQQARSLELRAATSLARLWQRQSKGAAAHALLTEVYSWFTEGLDTAALQESKALLATLAGVL